MPSTPPTASFASTLTFPPSHLPKITVGVPGSGRGMRGEAGGELYVVVFILLYEFDSASPLSTDSLLYLLFLFLVVWGFFLFF